MGIEEWLPEKDQEFFEKKGLLESVEDMAEEDLKSRFEELVSLRNPEKFPIEFKNALQEFIDFQVPQIREQTEEDIRRQLQTYTDSIRVGGTPPSILNFMVSLGYKVDMRTLVSNDYQDFYLREDVIFSDDYQYTPHVRFEITPTQLIQGVFIDEEIFTIIKERINLFLWACVVPQYRLKFQGFAEEDSEVLENDGVYARTTDAVQVGDPVKAGVGHKAIDTNSSTEYDINGAEAITNYAVGTIEVTDTVEQTLQNAADLDTTLFSDTIDPEPRGDLGGVRLEANFEGLQDSYIGETFNAVVFYDEAGTPMVISMLETEQEIFATDSELQTFLNILVLDSPVSKIRSRISSNDSSNTYRDSTAWIIDNNYDYEWYDKPRRNYTLRTDSGASLDSQSYVPYLATVHRKGSFRVGNLDGAVDDGPHIDGNDLHNELFRSDNFAMYFQEGYDYLIFRAGLNYDKLYGEEIEQVGIYDENDDLLVVVELDEPVVIDGQTDLWAFRLRMENETSV